eukprot:3741862-Amphidinium_carterae.1
MIASAATKQGFVLKISIFSGRYACLFDPFVHTVNHYTANTVLLYACAALGIRRNGEEVFVHGADVMDAVVQDWPGLRQLGNISEFQIVVRQDT